MDLPLLVQRRVVQDRRGDASSVDRWVRVHWTNDDLELTVHAGFLLGRRGCERERADTFTVETHVLK